MYGLLNEEVLVYTFEGTVTSSLDKETLEYINVSIVSDNKTIGLNVTDSEGKYSITSKLDSSKSYKFILQDSDKKFEKIERDIDLSKTKQVVNFELTPIKGILEFGEFTQSAQRATNIDFNIKDVNGKPLTDYRLKITTNKKTILDQTFLITNPSITILKSDLVLNNLQAGTEYESVPVEGSDFNKDKNEIVEVSIEVTKDGFSTYSKDFNIKSGNFVLNIPSLEKTVTKRKKEEKINYIKPSGSEEITVNENDKNIINVTLEIPKPEQISFKIIDQNKNVVSDANLKLEINGESIGDYVTNSDGVVSFNFKDELVGEDIFVTFEKDGYKRTIKNFKVGDNNNSFLLKVLNTSSGSDDDEVTYELNDKFKDSRNVIYGRGKTDLSQEEAYKLAKLDIVNKYVKRHKNRYKDIPVLKNQDIDLKYEFVYRKPLDGSDEHFIMLRSTSKDIRSFLKTYGKKEEIKKPPKTGNYKEMTLREGLEDSYYYGKEVLVIFGLEGSENTEKILNHIFIDLYEYYSKYYTLVFVNNSDNQSEKDLSTIVDKNNSTINTYPRVIKLKRPTSMKEINDLEIKITSNVPGRNYLQK
jgi:hypothetical protein